MRNSFGMAFDPVTGWLWATDNGPACNDELNRVHLGRNMGWGPSATCDQPPVTRRDTNRDGPDPFLPRAVYGRLGITGVAFCDGCGLGPGFEGDLVVRLGGDR